MTSSTTYRTRGKDAATLADVTTDSVISAEGTLNADGSLNATAVQIHPAGKGPKPFRGPNRSQQPAPSPSGSTTSST